MNWKDKTAEEIGQVFLDHWKFMDTQGKEGQRADLSQFDFRGMDLSNAELYDVNRTLYCYLCAEPNYL